MTSFVEVVVPQLGVNDESVRVAAWRVAQGARVGRGTVLAELETSKAAFELEAEAEGFFYPLAAEGAEAPIRGAIGLIAEAADAELITRYRSEHAPAPIPAPGAGAPQLTAKARLLAERFGIDVSSLPVGRILREEDIRRLAAETSSAGVMLPDRGDAVVYGASQGGMVVVEAMRSMGRYRPVGFLDDNPYLVGADFEGLPVWAGSDLPLLSAKGIVGVGTHMAKAAARLSLRARAAEAGIALLNVVHAQAWVAPTVRMGAGNLIKAGAIVDDFVTMEDCCIIDNGAVVPHHNRLASGVHLAPGVCMGGDCEIGEETIVGVGATIAPRVRIGRRVIIGVGAIITRDVPDSSIVEGASAKIAGSRIP